MPLKYEDTTLAGRAGVVIKPVEQVSFYANVNARLLKDNVASLIGKPLANAPKHTTSWFTRYSSVAQASRRARR